MRTFWVRESHSDLKHADWIELGRIGAPYGVKGWVHVESFTDPPQGLLRYGTWRVQTGPGVFKSFRLAAAREHNERLVAQLEGIEDRDAAALLRGACIGVARGELPPTKEREYYRADLMGFAVRNLEDAALGTLEHFVEAPAGALMVIRGEAGEHWVPATSQYLRQVDLVAGVVTVDWPLELE